MRTTSAYARTRSTVRHRPATGRIVLPGSAPAHAPTPVEPESLAAPRPGRSPERLGLAFRWYAVVGVLTVAALGVLALRLHAYDLAYEVATLRSENQVLEQEGRELRVKVTALTEPSVIAERAKRELGMHPPDPHQLRPIE